MGEGAGSVGALAPADVPGPADEEEVTGVEVVGGSVLTVPVAGPEVVAGTEPEPLLLRDREPLVEAELMGTTVVTGIGTGIVTVKVVEPDCEKDVLSDVVVVVTVVDFPPPTVALPEEVADPDPEPDADEATHNAPCAAKPGGQALFGAFCRQTSEAGPEGTTHAQSAGQHWPLLTVHLRVLAFAAAEQPVGVCASTPAPKNASARAE